MGIQGLLTSLVLTLLIMGYIGLGLGLVAKWMGSYSTLEKERPTFESEGDVYSFPEVNGIPT
ncbi:MAG TPA: hypothetical protein VFA07_12015 [Chthonomonadaceae bacterium]|nr:hypothetical protein [Chthonomonadaceae bacterium]